VLPTVSTPASHDAKLDADSTVQIASRAYLPHVIGL
jgi:hypothetical protein